MDSFSIIAAGVCGAIGGLVGALAAYKISNKHIKSAVMIAPTIFSIQLGPILLTKSGIRDMISPRTKLEKAMDDPTVASQYSALVKAASKMTKEEAKAFANEKTRLGLKRLNHSELAQWNRLRLKLAEANPALCAGFWTGQGVTGEALEALVGALNSLPEEDVNEWLKISQRAAILEIEQNAFTAPPEGAFAQGLMNIKSTLNTDDDIRFTQALQVGANAKNEEACWTIKKVLGSVDSMEPKIQEDFLRSMAAL